LVGSALVMLVLSLALLEIVGERVRVESPISSVGSR